MNAWFVSVTDWGYPDNWGDYVHGETASKAKAMFWREWSQEAGEWTNLRARRVPEFDDRPFTEEEILALYDDLDFYDPSFDSWEKPEEWHPICDCEICKAAKND